MYLQIALAEKKHFMYLVHSIIYKKHCIGLIHTKALQCPILCKNSGMPMISTVSEIGIGLFSTVSEIGLGLFNSCFTFFLICY